MSYYPGGSVRPGSHLAQQILADKETAKNKVNPIPFPRPDALPCTGFTNMTSSSSDTPSLLGERSSPMRKILQVALHLKIRWLRIIRLGGISIWLPEQCLRNQLMTIFGQSHPELKAWLCSLNGIQSNIDDNGGCKTSKNKYNLWNTAAFWDIPR